MELMQDGVVAALAAIGVTALLWLAASVLRTGKARWTRSM